ncbi:hypothetical protein BDM02DRAFT_2831058 [Thelephora ganbajun]|uniref:Uncharacterized protein n=1 Tax=Thelephora ganbajun TaxID=370292 RepID=A0ACB6ZBV4_THEGA|nr:hypothetical protein BDM02DRAFT_2831058 [Thelephora ganbajun]
MKTRPKSGPAEHNFPVHEIIPGGTPRSRGVHCIAQFTIHLHRLLPRGFHLRIFPIKALILKTEGTCTRTTHCRLIYLPRTHLYNRIGRYRCPGGTLGYSRYHMSCATRCFCTYIWVWSPYTSNQMKRCTSSHLTSTFTLSCRHTGSTTRARNQESHVKRGSNTSGSRTAPSDRQVTVCGHWFPSANVHATYTVQLNA